MALGGPRRVTTRDERIQLQGRAVWLELATVAWNIGEAVLTISLGIAAGSLALIGFGMDSIIEVFASAVVVWHIRPNHEVDQPSRTRVALRLVASAFLALAVSLAFLSLRDLITGREADGSLFGIGYLAVTALVMFGLAVEKRRLAERLLSAPLRSEASMTFLDGILSLLTLSGLALNSFAGLAWADPLAALLVAVAAANEARNNWFEARDLAETSRP